MIDLGALPTGIGSLPYTDVTEAVEAVLDLTPELPAAPQLPARTPAEAMVTQILRGVPGVTIGRDGSVKVADARRLALPDPSAPLDRRAWGGTLAFLDAVAARRGPIKLQLAGPVTVGIALDRAGVPTDQAFDVAAAAVDQRARALVDQAKASAPHVPLVVVFDEPGLVLAAKNRLPVSLTAATDLLSGRLAALGSAGAAVAGVHCCGPTDWTIVFDAGPDLVSLPVEAAAALDGGALAAFLDRDGLVIWGAIPTDRPLGQRDDIYWRRLSEVWCELSRLGSDPMQLRTQGLISPACGLGRHAPNQVAQVFRLVRTIAERVQDQTMAARLSAGA